MTQNTGFITVEQDRLSEPVTMHDLTEESVAELRKKYEEEAAKASAPKEAPKQETADEEDTFSKRYSDLRSHTAKKEAEYLKRIQELEEEANELKRTQVRDSNKLDIGTLTRDQVKELVDQYPDVFRAVNTLVDDRMEALKDEYRSLKNEVARRKRKEGLDELKKLHPDLDIENLGANKSFRSWYSRQPASIQEIFNKSNDPYEVGKQLTLYKVEEGIDTPKDKKVKASMSVDVSTSPAVNNTPANKRIWRASEVKRLIDAGGDAYPNARDEIAAAVNEGRFDYES